MAKKKPSREELALTGTGEGENVHQAMARHGLRPTVRGLLTMHDFGRFSKADLNTTLEGLVKDVQAVQSGDMSRCEETLLVQAHVLDVVFHDLLQLYKHNFDINFPAAEKLMRLAFKAQSQCRTTIEALSAVKNPPVVYARQANIAHGHQQVNNSVPDDVRMRKSESQPNKLLEQNDGERLDPGATSEAGRSDTPLEAVGTVDGAEDI